MTHNNYQIATMGGGCFWCTEAVLQRLNGVISIESGYTNGLKAKPSYQEVCSGKSGAVEVVQVTFDPSLLSYYDLLQIFMISHDPTSLNRQGGDAGTQYRSGIYYHNDDQKAIATKVVANLSALFPKPIVTEIEPITNYSTAETYHQNYYNNNQQAGYCQMVIAPKVAKLRAAFADKMKPMDA